MARTACDKFNSQHVHHVRVLQYAGQWTHAHTPRRGLLVPKTHPNAVAGQLCLTCFSNSTYAIPFDLLVCVSLIILTSVTCSTKNIDVRQKQISARLAEMLQFNTTQARCRTQKSQDAPECGTQISEMPGHDETIS